MGRQIVGHVLFALVYADFLIAAYLRDHLHATKRQRSAIDKRRVSPPKKKTADKS